MPLFSAPSPLLISSASSPATTPSGSHHPHTLQHHHSHRAFNQFRSPQSNSTNNYFNTSYSSPSQHASSSSALPTTAASGLTTNPSGKRSRDDDDDDDDAQMSAVGRDGSVSPPQGGRPSPRSAQSGAMRSQQPSSGRPIVHKKLRAFAGQQGQGGNGAGADGNAAAAASIDLGKMLASLDRPELLSLLMRLLTSSTDPSLPAQIQSLLPAPSLESINTTLNALEAAIQQAMPIAGARAEYVWGRVRGPLNEFATTAVGFAETLLQRRNNAPSTSSSGSSTTELDPDGHVHATTAFAFLLDLTGRVLRIERTLPPPPKSIFFATPAGNSSSSAGSNSTGRQKNSQQTSAFLVFQDVLRGKTSSSSTASSSAFSTLSNGGASSADALVTILVPTLLSQWDTLLRRLSSAVNGQGRMFGQEVVLGWYRALNALGSEGAPRSSNVTNKTPAFSAFGGSSASFQPRPSFGFSYGGTTTSSSFGFGAAPPTSTTSSFGFGSMSAPPVAATTTTTQQQEEGNVRAEEESLRVAMDWVKDVFEREIGWLVGLDKMRAAAASGGLQ
ncbi:hypothetical protein A4X13_0g70 [Tilletia indica]|uniref:Tethering factor for nuclear proteasome STS1 n=1 Tax=Tilletia indica TaxID=43049 RepID=A0A177TKH2_9BASI|nr:hypothetical protein A4X13_0g70 [Tilletia indica]